MRLWTTASPGRQKSRSDSTTNFSTLSTVMRLSAPNGTTAFTCYNRFHLNSQYDDHGQCNCDGFPTEAGHHDCKAKLAQPIGQGLKERNGKFSRRALTFMLISTLSRQEAGTCSAGSASMPMCQTWLDSPIAKSVPTAAWEPDNMANKMSSCTAKAA